jgi:hypothetical protein
MSIGKEKKWIRACPNQEEDLTIKKYLNFSFLNYKKNKI